MQLEAEPKRPLVPRGLKIALIVVASVVLVLTGAYVALLAALGEFAPNVAKAAAEPVARAIEANGGRHVCASGNAGYGPVNRQPWHQAFYEIEDSPDLAQTMIELAAREGHILAEPPESERLITAPSQELRNAASDPDLEMFVFRGSEAQAGCVSGTRPQPAAEGNAIVEIHVTSPEVSKDAR